MNRSDLSSKIGSKTATDRWPCTVPDKI